jgi:hypothetical protein
MLALSQATDIAEPQPDGTCGSPTQAAPNSVEDRHSFGASAVSAAARIGTRRPGWSHTSAYRAGPHRTHVTRGSRNLWRRNHLVYEVGEIAQPNNGCIPRPVATRDAWYFDCARHDQRGSDRRSSLNFSLFHLWFLSRGARVHDVLHSSIAASCRPGTASSACAADHPQPGVRNRHCTTPAVRWLLRATIGVHAAAALENARTLGDRVPVSHCAPHDPSRISHHDRRLPSSCRLEQPLR